MPIKLSDTQNIQKKKMTQNHKCSLFIFHASAPALPTEGRGWRCGVEVQVEVQVVVVTNVVSR